MNVLLKKWPKIVVNVIHIMRISFIEAFIDFGGEGADEGMVEKGGQGEPAFGGGGGGDGEGGQAGYGEVTGLDDMGSVTVVRGEEMELATDGRGLDERHGTTGVAMNSGEGGELPRRTGGGGIDECGGLTPA